MSDIVDETQETVEMAKPGLWDAHLPKVVKTAEQEAKELAEATELVNKAIEHKAQLLNEVRDFKEKQPLLRERFNDASLNTYLDAVESLPHSDNEKVSLSKKAIIEHYMNKKTDLKPVEKRMLESGDWQVFNELLTEDDKQTLLKKQVEVGDLPPDLSKMSGLELQRYKAANMSTDAMYAIKQKFAVLQTA